MGFVFQSFNLLPTLTVLDNVMLPRLLDGGDRRAAARREYHAVGKSWAADRSGGILPSQLSGGEAQRAAVARAIVAEPNFLLADEPTGSLDSENGFRVMELLADINRQLQVTILLATHSGDSRISAEGPFIFATDRFKACQSDEKLPYAFRQFILRAMMREKGRAAIVLLRIALGVAVMIAIRVANRSVTDSFRAAVDSVGGAAT